MSGANRFICTLLVYVGNSLVALGCVGLVMAAGGVIRAELFDVGISSGIRVIGSVAITGCLMSAIGYRCMDHFKQ